MPPKKVEKSPSSTPVPSTEAAQRDGPALPDAEWSAMQRVLNAIYDYRTEDGFDPSKLFQRKVNKRVIPEYYETIKEPVALSTIKQKINTRAYQSFREFVRDFALIPHNAQVFNRPDSGAFQDALVIKEQLEKNLQNLVDEGIVSKEVTVLPNLGDIPTFEDIPMEEPEEEEEESDAEGEEDDEEDEDEEAVGKKKRRGPRPSTVKGDGEGTTKRARGRPPKLLTPMEARINAVIKGIRKPKNEHGQQMIFSFDNLPDKRTMPEYYVEVKNPIAFDLLKRKVKRKKYRSLEQFMEDVNLMFSNAMSYNTDDSQIYKDAKKLQIEAGRLYDAEKAKSDASFVDDEGKMPMPDGILHNGELYKVGDWIHLQNPNDLTKPIPAQIYRTYRNPNGQNMVNVCWYYRPEQTVHRFDKHFFPHEVVKTGRYRDHHIEEVEGRCFIMFTTRYFKGRPRGLPEGIEIYVCEARYNEERHQFNKIKTWASCLPDEVRDRDYEMDLFEQPRKMKKTPSPIAYTLKPEQKETDELPKPTWGAEGAPPKIGAVHRRPRGTRDSPPPEPTPPPPPKQPTPPPRQMPHATPMMPSPATTAGRAHAQIPRPPSTVWPTSYGAAHPGTYAQASTASPAPVRPPSATPQTTYTPSTPQQAPSRLPIAPQTSMHSQVPMPPAMAQPLPTPASTYAPRPLTASSGSYRDPPPVEVYILPDQANLSIPEEIRKQYQRDEQGRVLFFTAPPLNPSADGGAASEVAGHSIRYLAARARREEERAAKRKQRDLETEAASHSLKKARFEQDEQTKAELDSVTRRAIGSFETQLAESLKGGLTHADMRRLEDVQRSVEAQHKERQRRTHERDERRAVRLMPVDTGIWQDDYDMRIS